MISVPNHLRLLSGNKVFIVLALFLFSSCLGTKRSTQRPDVEVVKTDGVKDIDEIKEVKVDTVEWTDNSNEEIAIENPPNIENTRSATSGLSYNISMIMPLTSTHGIGVDNTNIGFVQFYAGAKMAAQMLEEEGVNLQINVSNQKDDTNLGDLMIGDADLIIGPYATSSNKNLLVSTMQFGQNNLIPVVSPWYSTSKIEDSNPFYVQIKPNLRVHFTKIADHVAKNFSSNEVVLIGRDRPLDRAWFGFFQQQYALTMGPLADSLDIFFVDENNLFDVEFEDPFFEEVINQGKKVFIIPNYRFLDEEYLYTLLNKLSTDRQGKQIIVYGMPIIRESNRINYDYYHALNMRLVVSQFVDNDEAEVIDFKRKYFDKYGAIPGIEAFEGYDLMLFLGRSLNKYGTSFRFDSSGELQYYLQSAFNLQSVRVSGSDDLQKVDFIENKHLDIIEFWNGKFRRL